MRGYRVPRKAGWDTHGLPVEVEVEKELGIHGKQQIEAYGVAEFNKLLPRERLPLRRRSGSASPSASASGSTSTTPTSPTPTSYIEIGLVDPAPDLGQGPALPGLQGRAATARAAARRSAATRWRRATRTSPRTPSTCASRSRPRRRPAGVAGSPARPSRSPSGRPRPGRCLGNVAAAVHPDVDYALVEQPASERFIAGRATCVDRDACSGRAAPRSAARASPARELLGLALRAACSRFIEPDKRGPRRHRRRLRHHRRRHRHRAHRARLRRGRHARRPGATTCRSINAVDAEGNFIAEVTPWAGSFVKDADPEIIARPARSAACCSASSRTDTPTRSAGAATRRCSTTPRPTWYIRTTAIKDELLANNERDQLVPGAHQARAASATGWRTTSTGRSRASATGARRCPSGAATTAAPRTASAPSAELRETGARPATAPDDAATCTGPTSTTSPGAAPSAAATMRRVPEVIDAWFDSGAMPVRAVALPVREPATTFERALPGRLHLRGHRPDARLVLHACTPWRRCSTGERRGIAYKNVICLGHILDEEGQKMTKCRATWSSPGRDRSTTGRRRDALVPVRQPPRGSRGASRRAGGRGGAQVPAHAVEHLQLLHDLRQPRRLRPQDGARVPRRASGRCSTAGSRRARTR